VVGAKAPQALVALARENGFSYFEMVGSAYLGSVAVHEGALDQGIKALLQGEEALRAAGEALTFRIFN